MPIEHLRVHQSFPDVLQVLDTEGNCLAVDGGAEWKLLIDARLSAAKPLVETN